jgi:predicted Zn-dependent protease
MWANYQQFAGNMTLAGKHYQDLLATKETPIYSYKGYIHYLAKIGNIKKVISLAPTIDDTFKDDPDLQLILISSLKKDNQKNAAIKQLKHAYNTFPHHTQIVFETASMYIDQKEFSNALQAIDKLLNNVSSQSNFFIFYFIKAQLYVQLGQLDKALESVKKSLDMHSSFDQGWLMRATIEEELGQINNAINGYTNFLKFTQQPNQQVSHHLMQLSLKQKMIQSYTPTTENNKSSLEKAMILYEQKNYTQALDAIETHLTHHPHNTKARIIKIQILSDMRQFNCAITQLQAWIYENPTQELWFETLHLLAQKGAEVHNIIKLFESLHTKYPKNMWVILYLSDLYLRFNAQNKAITLLEKTTHTIQDKNLLAKIFFQLGLLHFDKKEYNKMQIALEQGLHLKTNFLPLMNLLAYHYATKGKNLLKAQQLMAQILTYDNTNPHLLDTHALILYKKQQYQDALQLLQNLHAKVPDDATIMLHLAQTHHKLNNKDLAHATLRNAQAMAKSTYEKNKIAEITKKWAL